MTQQTDSNDSQRTELRALVAELKRRIKGDLSQEVIGELLKELDKLVSQLKTMLEKASASKMACWPRDLAAEQHRELDWGSDHLEVYGE